MKTYYYTFLQYLAENGITPNGVTIFRGWFFAFLMILWYIAIKAENPELAFVVLFLVVPVWFLDMVDGDLARQTSQLTDTGKWLDPLVDKIKVYLTFFVLFQSMSIYGQIFVMILFMLDFLSTFARIKQKGEQLNANNFGKWKLVFQIVASVFIAITVLLELYQVKTNILLYFADIFLFLATLSALKSVIKRFYSNF